MAASGVCSDHSSVCVPVRFLLDPVLKSWIIFSIKMVYVTAGPERIIETLNLFQ